MQCKSTQMVLPFIKHCQLIICVGEVPDGTADSVVEHIDRKLNRLRLLTHKFKLKLELHSIIQFRWSINPETLEK